VFSNHGPGVTPPQHILQVSQIKHTWCNSSAQ